MNRNPAIEGEALEYISSLIYNRCRIRLDAGKHALIKSRLGKRIRFHGFEDLSEYCHFLQTTAGEDEFTLVIDALTTNFTHFMREPDHFEFLGRNVFPQAAKDGDNPFRVWSAACSSGEEPYTLAFHLAEFGSKHSSFDWNVTASDISTKVLDKAKLGIYDEERIAPLPREWVPRYFQKGIGKWSGSYRVKRAVTERVSFRQINLIENYTHSHLYQTVFCRNVMIYFDRTTQEQLVTRLCRFIAPRGFLIIGHSESLNGLNVPLRCLRPSIYQRL